MSCNDDHGCAPLLPPLNRRVLAETVSVESGRLRWNLQATVIRLLVQDKPGGGHPSCKRDERRSSRGDRPRDLARVVSAFAQLLKSRDVLAEIEAGLGDTLVDLRLPQWDFNTGLPLVPLLQELGMDAPFGEDADFSAITTDADQRHLARAVVDLPLRGNHRSPRNVVSFWYLLYSIVPTCRIVCKE